MTTKILNSKDLTYLVSTCLNLELFEDAYEYVTELVKINKGILNEEERNLFMRSMKGKLNLIRNGWKTLMM